jgi:hypothetical protein
LRCDKKPSMDTVTNSHSGVDGTIAARYEIADGADYL